MDSLLLKATIILACIQGTSQTSTKKNKNKSKICVLKSIVGVTNEEASLFCNYSTNLKKTVISLLKVNGSTEMDTFSTNYTIKIGSSGRFKLARDRKSGRASIIIKQLRYSDNGIYFCEVQEDHNKLTAPGGTQLTVEGAPEVKQLARSNPKGIVDLTKLICKVEGVPTPNITWIVPDGFPMPLNETKLTSKKWFISTCMLEHRGGLPLGTYTCRARNQYGEASKDIRLAVSVPRVKDALSSDSKTFKIMSSVGAIVGGALVTMAAVIFIRHKRQRSISDVSAGVATFETTAQDAENVVYATLSHDTSATKATPPCHDDAVVYASILNH
ncbi:V-set and immunoglobulin domain-containing protein 2 [Petromyzon marinus]|uniref:Vascular endothelial growth factor receptor 2 n=1 Tax=Petromyzon marinus TaxID=7757 RepID=A0AAJ7TL71_PETMA|nr:vascular endothelial growth factor receptor 2 [Petromyzon marinus]XP_032818941.1 vascular endothelial growth factor receptor 2 [Petromyzon marinus]XP_032818942.1 vascular endothelial growth factor receptor 2 [Petromyzon marinus]